MALICSRRNLIRPKPSFVDFRLALVGAGSWLVLLDPLLDAVESESRPLAAVEVIAVDVEHGVTVSGGSRGDNRLLQAGANDNDL